MVRVKVVCERWCVWKIVCDTGRGAGEAEEAGYRIQNKKHTQGCGEKLNINSAQSAAIYNILRC